MNGPIKRMNVPEFLDWTMSQPGRYELIEGLPVKLPAERMRHVRVIEPEDGFLTRHERLADGRIETRIYEREGELILNPPGLRVSVPDFLP